MNKLFAFERRRAIHNGQRKCAPIQTPYPICSLPYTSTYDFHRVFPFFFLDPTLLSFSTICVRLASLRKINKSIPLSTTFVIFRMHSMHGARTRYTMFWYECSWNLSRLFIYTFGIRRSSTSPYSLESTVPLFGAHCTLHCSGIHWNEHVARKPIGKFINFKIICTWWANDERLAGQRMLKFSI